MTRRKTTRGKNPSDSTIRILWGKAAGICEYRGCNENYFMMKQQRMSLTQHT